MKLSVMRAQYWQAINPPYTKKDIPAVLGTLFILLVLPITVLAVVQSRDQTSIASGKGTPTPFPTSGSLVLQGPNRGTLPDGTQCFGEDDMADSLWSGDMSPGQIFTVDVPFCGVGNPGLIMKIDSASTGVTWSAAAPAGVYYPATTYNSHDLGIVSRQYSQGRCFWPPWGVGVGGVGGSKDVVSGGHWILTLTNTNSTVAKSVNYHVKVTIDYPSFQSSNCLKDDWTFIPPRNKSPYTNGSSVAGIVNLTFSNAINKDNSEVIGQYTSIDLHVNQTGGKSQKNLYSTILHDPQTYTTAPASFTVPWDTRNVPNGTYNLYPLLPGLAAYGTLGGITGDSFTLTVNNTTDTTAPVVSITLPTNGSTVSGTAVNINVTASDNIGVTKVNFLVDGVVVGTSSTSPYSFSWDSTKVANGTHTISAIAFDSANNFSGPSTISVAVSN